MTTTDTTDPFGNRWVGPVDGIIVVEIFGDELALLQAAVRQAADFRRSRRAVHRHDRRPPVACRGPQRRDRRHVREATGTLPTPGAMAERIPPGVEIRDGRPTVAGALKAAGWTPREACDRADQVTTAGAPEPTFALMSVPLVQAVGGHTTVQRSRGTPSRSRETDRG